MESLKKIKKELHEYIDSVSDEKELMVIYENALKYLKSDLAKDNTNENDHRKRLDETINQGSSGDNKSDKELKKSMARWLTMAVKIRVELNFFIHSF